ncbi:hypothetical protein KIMH_01700 [Bombiscardovia apis]|uniref:RCC1-like domain-containing protein n=1 Tax=Bombiscardovia apis TaxID=2932182 RepID=A0ABN6SDB9_9BIFI|nr:hypothetical protein KIMH_01700 [Bombiscardovia apis]
MNLLRNLVHANFSGDKNIADLSPLEHLQHLKTLDVSDNKVVDISPLKGLGELSEVRLAGNHIADLTPISPLLPQLTTDKKRGFTGNDILLPDGAPAQLQEVRLKTGLVDSSVQPVRGAKVDLDSISPAGGKYDAATGDVVWSQARPDTTYSFAYSAKVQTKDAEVTYSGTVKQYVRAAKHHVHFVAEDGTTPSSVPDIDVDDDQSLDQFMPPDDELPTQEGKSLSWTQAESGAAWDINTGKIEKDLVLRETWSALQMDSKRLQPRGGNPNWDIMYRYCSGSLDINGGQWAGSAIQNEYYRRWQSRDLCNDDLRPSLITAPSGVGVNVVAGSGIFIEYRPGYSFEGWLTDDGRKWDFLRDKVSKNGPTQHAKGYPGMVLHANWVRVWKVTVECNGGVCPIRTQYVHDGEYAQSSGPPIYKLGYNFEGWTDDRGRTWTGASSYPITGDITLTAHWSIRSYNITFHANDNSGRNYSFTAVYQSTINQSDAPTYSRNGYKFLGWSRSPTSTVADVTLPCTVTYTDMNFYAVWSQRVMVNVTFNTDGGTAIPVRQVEKGTPIGTGVPNPTKNGYDFRYWTTSSGVQWDLANEPVNADMTLYAKWEIRTFVIHFDTNGGSPTIPDSNVRYKESVARPENPSRNGYDFAGWFTSSDEPWDFGTAVTSSLTLKAKWDSYEFVMSQNRGPKAGGTAVSIEQTRPSNVKFTQVAGGDDFSLALGSDGYLYSWGKNVYGQLGDNTNTNRTMPVRVRTPAGVTFSSIAVSSKTGLAVGSDGKAYAWGLNWGQLGNSSSADKTYPVVFQLPAGVRAQQVAGGSRHSLVLGDDGKVYAAGFNAYHQVSDDPRTGMITTPVAVSAPGGHRFTAVAAGDNHSLALSEDGTLWAWGDNGSNQLGFAGASTGAPRSVTMPAGVVFTSMSAGSNFSAAISSTGDVYTWGANGAGQLGNGNTTSVGVPTKIALPAGSTPVARLAAHGTHILALTDSQQAYAWGNNANGQLGNGSTSNATSPISITLPGGATPASVGAGSSHSLAVSTKGDLYTWGSNAESQLGNGSNTEQHSPTASKLVTIAVTDAKFGNTAATGSTNSAGVWKGSSPAHAAGNVSVAVSWTIAGMKQTNTSLSWYYTDSFTIHFDLGGAPGNAPADQTFEEGQGKHATWPVVPIRPGYEFAGWFTASGQPFDFTTPVRASVNLTARWDVSEFKLTPQAGRVTGGTHLTLSGPGQPGFRFTQVCAGSDYSVALGSNGLIYAWGNNSSNQLGDESTVTRRAPVRVHTPAGVTFTSIAASPKSDYTMAVGSDGKAYAWGSNRYGLLSNGGNRDNTKPEEYILPAGVKAVEVAAGIRHSLVLSQDGKVYATGVNYYGEVANNTNVNTYYTAIPVSLPAGKRFVHIAAGEYFSLALSSDGQLYSWGYNNNGRLGDGDITEHADPRPVSLPPGVSFTQIAAQHDYAAAIGDDNNVYTWGSNVKGQLGTGDTTPRRQPTKITLPGSAKAASIATGESHTLALTTTGSAYAWGNDGYGQLGTGNSVDQLSPTPLSGVGNNTFTTISAGYDHSLAVNTAGDMYAWGSSADGRLGDGTFYNKNEPSPVTKLTNNVTGFNLGGTAVTGFSSTGGGSWKADSAAHADGKVDVEIHWSKAGEEQTYTITKGYEYYTFAKLTKAGALPAKRTAGLTLIASSSCLAGCYIIMRKRQGAGRHAMR